MIIFKSVKTQCIMLLLIISGYYCHNLYAEVIVVGFGKQEVAPNLASFSAIIETKSKTAADAAQQNAIQTDKTIKLLTSLLNNDKAVTTQGYSVYPDYKYNRDTAETEFVGFKVINTVNVKTNKIKELGTLLDQTINSGVTKVDNLVFQYDSPEEIYQDALDNAVANAKKRANVLAKAGDLKLKSIRDIKIVSTGYTPSPRPMMARATLAAAEVSTPIEAPDVKTEATVEVVFETE